MRKSMLRFLAGLAIAAAAMVGCAVEPDVDDPVFVHIREGGVEAAVYELGAAGEVRAARTIGSYGRAELLRCHYDARGLLEYATREDAVTNKVLGALSSRTFAAEDGRPSGSTRSLTDAAGRISSAVATCYYGPDGALVGIMQVDSFGNVLSQGAADGVATGGAIAADGAAQAASRAARGIAQEEGPRDRFMNTVIDLRSGVLDFRPEGLVGAIRDGALARPSPADLSVGDLFIDVDGVARRAASVVRRSRAIYVDAVRPAPEEIFLYVAIPDQTVSFAAAAAAMGDGAVVADETSRALTVNIATFEKELYKSPDERKVLRLSLGGSLTSDVSIGMVWPTVTMTDWKFWLAESYRQDYGYIRGDLSWGVDLSGAVSFALEGSLEPKDPWLLKGFETPKTGVDAGLGLYLKPSLEGSLTLSIPFTFGVTGNAGAQCTLAGSAPIIWPTDVRGWGSTGFRVSLDPSLEGAVTAKLKFFLGAKVKVIGVTMTDFEAGGGPYLKVSGSASASIGYDSTKNPRLIGPTGTLELSGVFGIFTGISGKIFDGKWTLKLLENEFPVWTFLDLSTEEEEEEAARALMVALPAGGASIAGAH